ncbi:MAG: phenylacetate-CoA oxygenase subunit PaaJ [Bacteroidota bacterium]|nr:phenylacetate-CoA oxygenase subunit PaaJ [Bacteroidota bacterium]
MSVENKLLKSAESLATESAAWEILKEVVDPEIPVLTIMDMGILRDVKADENGIEVTITPTYSGCPAMEMIAEEIKSALSKKGFSNVTIKSVLSPAWTTDWITEEGKAKLFKYGIAPPAHSTADKGALLGNPKSVKCPQCKSEHTEMISNFGSTACKALWKCLDCKEPFDYFKCI